eukprot:TRINITY_DN6037_c0_g1_i1.p1 TRINITY_DN6037_c0_g1~~TRINITY_DN6037_c0_g1_i1.p1  ORF type:complete len:424 (+),score=140.55 TRINITY_DN6037_c0_g1_i1:82-1353(+)
MDLLANGIPQAEAKLIAAKAAQFVEKYKEVHDTHIEDFFTSKPLANVASDITDALTALSVDDLLAFPEISGDIAPPLKAYVDDVAASSLPGSDIVVLSTQQKRRRKFTPKKLHEAEQLAALVNTLASKTPTEWVINVGEGKGHLSEVIAETAKYKGIIGLDCDIHREAVPDEGAAFKMYSIKCKVTLDMSTADLADVVNKVIPDKPLQPTLEHSGLIGLHACGDLGSHVVKTFASSSASFLALAPCCYHALTEEGFPLSDCLKACNTPLGSTRSRAVACIASAKWSAEGSQLEKYKLHYYRAVASTMLHPERLALQTSVLRRLAKRKDLSLQDFVKEAYGSIGKSEEEIAAALKQAAEYDTECSFKRFLAFMTLRRTMSEPLESLYLLDRYLYLLQSTQKCALLPLFDPKLSPRSYVLVAVSG